MAWAEAKRLSQRKVMISSMPTYILAGADHAEDGSQYISFTWEVSAYYNTNFINYKLDMEKGENTTSLRNTWHLQHPTFVFVDGDEKKVQFSCWGC